MEYSREQLIERLQTNLDAWHTENAVVLMPIEPKPDKPCLRDIVAELRRTESSECRVMTLEEVLNAENEAEPLWCEFIDCALGSWRMGWRLKTEGKREVQHILENPIERAIVWESEYEKGWRCWTSRPDEKRREETPWNAQK